MSMNIVGSNSRPASIEAAVQNLVNRTTEKNKLSLSPLKDALKAVRQSSEKLSYEKAVSLRSEIVTCRQILERQNSNKYLSKSEQLHEIFEQLEKKVPAEQMQRIEKQALLSKIDSRIGKNLSRVRDAEYALDNSVNSLPYRQQNDAIRYVKQNAQSMFESPGSRFPNSCERVRDKDGSMVPRPLPGAIKSLWRNVGTDLAERNRSVEAVAAKVDKLKALQNDGDPVIKQRATEVAAKYEWHIAEFQKDYGV